MAIRAGQGSFQRALLDADRVTAAQAFEAVGEAERPLEVVEQLVVPALTAIGDGWQRGDVALAQVYMAGRICEELVGRLFPDEGGLHPGGARIAIGVLDDHHTLGKRIVHACLRAGGHAMLDYGHGLTPEAMASRAVEDQVQVLLVSTLMLPSALRVRELSALLAAVPDRPKLVVGGAPYLFDEQLWQHVGADAMGRSAADALTLVGDLLGGA
jgi:trimethylamine corrinoid protein